MFLDYYGLKEQPFGVTPDPRYLYETPARQEALAGLVYGIETGRGFMALVGPPGTGKTTLLFELLDRLHDSARTAFLFQTQCNSRELFHYLLSDLGVDPRGQNLAEMHTQLNEMLLAEAKAGRHFVMIIDEAQDLEESTLETVRLLSNFETARAKLLQIILAGQPRLAEKLSSRGLLQLRQRISILSHLEPFAAAEVSDYISHRLRVAGYQGPPLFTSEALAMIFSLSQGIPRDVNNLCFNALSLGYALEQKVIDQTLIEEVSRDLNLGPLVAPPPGAAETPASSAGGRAVLVGAQRSINEPGSQDVAVAPGPEAFTSPASHAGNGPLASPPPPAPDFLVEEPDLDGRVTEDVESPLDADSPGTAAGWDDEVHFPSAPVSPTPAGWRPNISGPAPRSHRTRWLFGIALLLLAVPIAGFWYSARPRRVPAGAATRQPAGEAAAQTRVEAPDSGQPAPADPAATPAGQPAAGQIQAQAPLPEPKPPASEFTGSITVTSNVRGAGIIVDGEANPNWTTPHRLRLPPGTHRLAVSRLGYERSEQEVKVTAGSRQEVRILLSRMPQVRHDSRSGDAEIDITTDPPGLEAFIDGRSVGLTPVQHVTTAGSHTCRVVPPPGKGGWQQTCSLAPGDIVQKRLKW